MDKYGSTSPAAAEWADDAAAGAGGEARGTARPVPRARVVGGLVLLAVCGLALVAGSVRAPLGPLSFDEGAPEAGTPDDSGDKQSGQPAPLACEAHLRSEVVLKGVEVTNMTATQKTLLETVAEDAIGKVLNGMTGFQAMTAIWSYPVDGKCWLKFYFQVEFLVIPGDETSDQISTGEELTNRAMRYLVKKIQSGDLAAQWWDSNVQLGSETFLFGNVSKTKLEDFIDEEMSIYAVDEDTKLLWLETCTPPSLAPVATYAPSVSQPPTPPPSTNPSQTPTVAPVTYPPTAAPQVPYPAPTVGPQISPTPRPTVGPTDAPSLVHTPSPSILPTEWHMTCVPSPCPGRKLDEFGIDIPMTKEEAAAQAADEAAAIAEMAERAAALPAMRDEQR